MTGRHLLLLCATAAVALCALFVIRALDEGDGEEHAEPLEAAQPPAEDLVRTVPVRTEPVPAKAQPVGQPAHTGSRAAQATRQGPVSVGLEEAQAATRRLAGLLRDRRASNEDLLAALAAVQGFYLSPPAPPGTVPHEDPARGSNAADRTVLEADLRAHAEKQGWPANYVDEVLAWRRKTEKLLLRALKLQHLDREQETNLRDAVNVKAAQVLGSTGSRKVSRGIMKALESTHFKARYPASQPLLDESFGALAKIGDLDSLEWMLEEFTHSKSSPGFHVDRLSAAHKAMRRFDRDKVPGASRYELVQQMIRSYAAVELIAEQNDGSERSRSGQELWNRIGKDTIRAVQYFAYDPKGDDGEALATLAEFQAWLRDHKDPRRPPWKSD